MSARVVAEQRITVSQKAVVEATSPDKKHVVVFEDGGDTGYFYAMDMRSPHRRTNSTRSCTWAE
jgi:hypothetical protein